METVKVYEGHLNAEGLKFGVVVSRFNDLFSFRLLEGAMEALRQCRVDPKDIVVVKVPGSYEVPLYIHELAQSGRFQALIALGVLIRGATAHFEYISAEVTRGIGQVMREFRIPVAFGIVTADSLEQAIERSGSKQGNKGYQAALAAVEMATLKKGLEGGHLV
jgi:6,7-dimethyl-8-ribityllumazine synthase